MAIWNLRKVVSAICDLHITDDREAENLAGWVWEEIMDIRSQTDVDLKIEEEEKIRSAISRIKNGEPVQYIAGHAWFYGIKLKVTSDVLIPRPETEELVAWVLEDMKSQKAGDVRILDVGTGSGCIAIALKKHLKESAFVEGIDISDRALAIATENASNLGLDIKFVEMDFLSDFLPVIQPYDLIVSNPPYVSRSFALHESLRFEPASALYAEGDDQDVFYKKIATSSRDLLKKGGSCYLEINEFRVDQIKGYFEATGWSDITVRKDLQGNDRMLRVTKEKDR